MEQHPEGDEVSVELAFKQPSEIHLHKGRAGHGRVVAQDSQVTAVANHTPEGVVGGVEVLLHQALRGAAAPFFTERGIAFVQLEIRAGEQQRHMGSVCTAKGQMGDRKLALTDANGPGGAQVKAKDCGEHGHQEALYGFAATGQVLALHQLLETFPVRAGHAPEAADFVAQLEGAVQAVVGAGLALEFLPAQVIEKLAGKKPAFHSKTVEFIVLGATHG